MPLFARQLTQRKCSLYSRGSNVAKFESDLLKNKLSFVEGAVGGRGRKFVPPTIQTYVCKIWRFCGAISSPTLDVIPLNSVSYLIFRPSFQECRWIFAYCSLTKVKGAVSRQPSTFCLILPIARPQSLWNLK